MYPPKGKRRSAHPMPDRELADLFHHFEAKRARREAIELLFLVNPSSFALSHIAAEDLKSSKELIYRAASEDRKEFFIELGKVLDGKTKLNTWSKLDMDIAFILCFDPKIKSPDAVELLKKLGHPQTSQQSFKQRKYNWRRAAAKTRQRLEESGWKYYGNTFLDDHKT